jgi:hypothetical protein
MRKFFGFILVVVAIMLIIAGVLNLFTVSIALIHAEELTSYGLGNVLGRTIGSVLFIFIGFKLFKSGRSKFIASSSSTSA